MRSAIRAAAYDEIRDKPGEYARLRRRGEARVARVVVTEEGGQG